METVVSLRTGSWSEPRTSRASREQSGDKRAPTRFATEFFISRETARPRWESFRRLLSDCLNNSAIFKYNSLENDHTKVEREVYVALTECHR